MSEEDAEAEIEHLTVPGRRNMYHIEKTYVHATRPFTR